MRNVTEDGSPQEPKDLERKKKAGVEEQLVGKKRAERRGEKTRQR